MRNNQDFSIETLLIHEGRASDLHYGAVNIPVYRASTILFPSYETFLNGDHSGMKCWREGGLTYGRRGTPITRELESALAQLEKGVSSFLCASGVAAISTALLAFLSSGDHWLMTDNVYTPTKMWAEGFGKRLKIDHTCFTPGISVDALEKLIRPETKVIFCESPGSLTFELNDLPAIVKLAEKYKITVIIDNSWGAGYYHKPLTLGAHISIQAATKYLGGHSDVLAGLIVARDETSAAKVRKSHYLQGQCIDGDTAYLILRGMRTLSVRLEAHFKNALQIAEYFENKKFVTRVLYPALPSSPDHAIWKRDFTGACGLFAIVLNAGIEEERVKNFINHLQLFGIGFSWGGYESMVMPCPFDLERNCVSDVIEKNERIIRFHIGLENVEDLKNDLEAAFQSAGIL